MNWLSELGTSIETLSSCGRPRMPVLLSQFPMDQFVQNFRNRPAKENPCYACNKVHWDPADPFDLFAL